MHAHFVFLSHDYILLKFFSLFTLKKLSTRQSFSVSLNFIDLLEKQSDREEQKQRHRESCLMVQSSNPRTVKIGPGQSQTLGFPPGLSWGLQAPRDLSIASQGAC